MISLTVGQDGCVPLCIDDRDTIGMAVDERVIPPAIIKNYEDLDNLPSLDGRTIIGNINEEDPTVPGWAKSPVRPSYTAWDVGAVAEDDLVPLTAESLEEMWDD